ncbi:hypothetical protein FRC07_006627 [Ceratobasidium sp. 392]|nr:hypothetical protein FRC07_006627 [Ceratobasidium sp. 392]
MWDREDHNLPESDNVDAVYAVTCVHALEKLYNSDKKRKSKATLKQELLHPETGEVFRAEFAAGLAEGHSQGQSDDLTELKKIRGHLEITGFGYACESIFEMLMTPSLLKDNSLD